MDYNFVLLLILQLLVAAGIFIFLVYIAKLIVNNMQSIPGLKYAKFLNPVEYFPEEKLASLKQIFYLSMVFIFIIIDLYLIFNWKDGSFPIFLLDIILSIYLVMSMSTDSLNDKIILFTLIPFGSINGIVFGDSSLIWIDLFHILGYFYFMQVYYRRFVKFTKSMGLGISVLLLFSIVWVSFLVTMLAEGVSPLESITMVSNAFTSNSYEASGNSVVGKLDSLILAWGCFLLSSVGTATLAASIVKKQVDQQFDDMENLIKSKKEEK